MSEPLGLAALHLDVGHLAPDAAVARLVEHASAVRASDLFLVSNETNVAALVRHLGILRLVGVLPKDLGRHCMAHIKAVAGMDVAEHRRPLDGRWIFERADGRHIDLRISTLPTLHGEDLTLRLLERSVHLLALDQLGLTGRDHAELARLLDSPSGLILVTGPTGSGKTTTLYACLAHLNNGERKLNTIEDPVEYAMAGTRQSQVNLALGVDFPELLRSVLRQAPDVIMIGEVRDPVTAQTAVRAANSGHLVLATLHAGVAAGAVQSMLGLGVHPHFLASALRGVIAQRLLRTLCPACRRPLGPADPAPAFDEVRAWLEPGEAERPHAARGCPACYGTGYAARSGVFEVLTVSPALRKLIVARRPMQALRRRAVREGLREFRQAALLKIARGETTAEEVFRVIPSEYLGPGE